MKKWVESFIDSCWTKSTLAQDHVSGIKGRGDFTFKCLWDQLAKFYNTTNAFEAICIQYSFSCVSLT